MIYFHSTQFGRPHINLCNWSIFVLSIIIMATVNLLCLRVVKLIDLKNGSITISIKFEVWFLFSRQFLLPIFPPALTIFFKISVCNIWVVPYNSQASCLTFFLGLLWSGMVSFLRIIRECPSTRTCLNFFFIRITLLHF